MNGTNRTVPMNEPVTVIMALVSAGVAVHNIIQRRRQSRQEKAEAHTAFMHEVYKIPGLTNDQHRMLHQMAENNLGDAARWVDNYLAEKIVQAEQEQQRLLDEQQRQQQRTPSTDQIQRSTARSSRDTSNSAEQTTDRILEDEYKTKGLAAGNWWATRSNTEKAAIVIGSAAVVGGIVYLSTRKKRKKRK